MAGEVIARCPNGGWHPLLPRRICSVPLLMDGVEPTLHLRVLSRVSDVTAAQWDASAPRPRAAGTPGTSPSGAAPPRRRGARVPPRGQPGGVRLRPRRGPAPPQRAGIRYYPKLVLAVPFTPCTGRRVLVAPGEDRAALSRGLSRAALASPEAERLSSVHVLFPTDDEAESPRPPRGPPSATGCSSTGTTRATADYDAFLARFDSKRRNQLRREAARAEQGITLRTRAGRRALPADAALSYRLYTSTVDKFVWGRRYLNEGFFAACSRRFLRAPRAGRGRARGRGRRGGDQRRLGDAPLRALLGLLRGAPLPALQRLLLPLHRGVHRRGVKASRAAPGASTSSPEASSPRSPARRTGSSTRGSTGRCGTSSDASARRSSTSFPRIAPRPGCALTLR
jgi:hypothetical protein